MHRRVRHAIVAAVACAVAAIALAGRSHAEETHREKAARLAEKMGYRERLREAIRREIADKHEGNPKEVDGLVARADLQPLMDLVAKHIETEIPEATIDDLLPYLDTAEGKRHVALMRVQGALLPVEILLRFNVDRAGMQRMEREFRDVWEQATTGVPVVRTSSNEMAAIATLRNLTSCQAQIQTSGKIDCDNDGIGEFGTSLEMTGTARVRNFLGRGAGPYDTWADFSVPGTKVAPAILSPSLANVDGSGVVQKGGYCFRIYLPDTAARSGFVHETNAAGQVGLGGGTGRIAVDLSEQLWCAYAWPIERGKTGTRAFFVNQAADVMQSANEVAKWSGPANGPPGPSAFWAGSGCTGRIAVGVKGDDGDVWKVTN